MPLEDFSVFWKEQKKSRSEVMNLQCMMKILLIFTLSIISGQLFTCINHIWSYLSWLVSVLSRVIDIKISFWLTGPVGCVDVIGYSEGSILIISDLYWSLIYSKYICKVENRQCTNIIHVNSRKDAVQVERFTLYKSRSGYLRVFIRKLKTQDAGRYSVGVGTQKTDVDLKVVNGYY